MKKKLILLSVLGLALNALVPSFSFAQPMDEPDICWGGPDDETNDKCTKPKFL